MKVEDLELVLGNLYNSTEVFIENSYGLKYKVKDYRIETTSKTEKLYLIMENNIIDSTDLYEESNTEESTKQFF